MTIRYRLWPQYSDVVVGWEVFVSTVRFRQVLGLAAVVCFVGQAYPANLVSALAQDKPSVANQGTQVDIADLNRDFTKYVNQRTVVKGTLRLLGTNYFKDPRFVLSDDTGNQVAVTAWAPLEIPPPFPGALNTERPLTMRDYMNKQLIVTGTFRNDLRHGNGIVNGIVVETVAENRDARVANAQDGSATPVVGASGPGLPVPGNVSPAGSSGTAQAIGTQAPVAAGPSSQGVPVPSQTGQTPPAPVDAGSSSPGTPVPQANR
jgi:hypothetical protein